MQRLSMREALRHLGAVALVAGSGCGIGHVDQKGPHPQITEVHLLGDAGDAEPVFCAAEGGILHIIGSGLAPAPRDVLKDTSTLEEPSVTLVCDGVPTALDDVSYDIVDKTLTARVPTGLAAATCDVSIVTPTGETATAPAAVTITATCSRIDLCGSVSPAYGWVNGRTTIEICANNADGNGLVAVPEVFLRIDPEHDGRDVVEVPLIREAMLALSTSAGGFTDASLMSATVPAANEERGAGVVVGGPYDIRVVNPDGLDGTIANAFVVLADPPPHITAISPEQADTQTAPLMHITGSNFKDPSTALSPRVARVVLLSADQAAAATCSAPTCFECASPALVSATEATCTPPTASMSAGTYVVRYEHLIDGSFSDYAALAITNPAGNLAQTTAQMPSLGTGRLAHGSVTARDDLGNRYVYVVGGQTAAAASSAIDSIEVSSLARFGQMGAWTTLTTALPAPRSGSSLVRQGSYLFLIGGRSGAGAVSSEVLRARILGSDTAPVIDAPGTATDAAALLAAGSYGYRVSAIMDGAGDNPNGETLPSDRETVRVSAGVHVTLQWAAVVGADHYRVYRSPVADALSGTEVLLAEVTGLAYVDDGTVAVDLLTAPQPSGALGVWASAGALTTARADAGSTIAHNADGAPFVYVVGGIGDGGTPIASCEYAPLTGTSSIPWQIGTFTGCTNLTTARSELLAVTVNATTAPRIDGIGAEYVLASQGTDGTSVSSVIEVAKVTSDGTLSGWTDYAGQPSKERYGASGVLVNNVLFSIGGRASNDAIQTRGLTASVCESGIDCATTDPPAFGWSSGDSGIVLAHGRYRGGLVCEGGLFYFTGGMSSDATVEASVERGSYQ